MCLHALIIWSGLVLHGAELPHSVPLKDARLSAKEGAKHDFTMPHYTSLAQWERRKEHLKKQILSAAGLLPMPPREPLRPQIYGKLDRDGYSIEKVYLETLPGYFLCGNLYRPTGQAGKHPGVISPHGHWRKGRIENTDLVSEPGRCINLARQGYVVFSYDMTGYNDTNQTKHEFGNRLFELWSFHPLGLQLWNSIRSVDFLESLPDVDPGRIAATGASGGATQTFLVAAVDERVHAAVPVNMISSFMQGDSPCENAPGLRHDTFNVEFAAMMAPRPMLVISATGDWTKHFPQVEYPAIQEIYDLYGASPELEQVQFDSPHNYHQGSREAMYTFLAQHLFQRADPVKEEPFLVESDDDLLAWSDRPRPENSVSQFGVFNDWRELTYTHSADREAMRYALSVEVPQQVNAELHGQSIDLSRPGQGDRVSGSYYPGVGTPIVVIHPRGAAVAQRSNPTHGRPILYLNPFPKTRHLLSWRFFSTFHRTDSQNRVQDILTAAAWLRSKHGPVVEVNGLEDAAVWATYAAAVDENLRLRGAPAVFGGTDSDFLRDFFVPGIRRVGGWEAALRLTEGRRLTGEESE